MHFRHVRPRTAPGADPPKAPRPSPGQTADGSAATKAPFVGPSPWVAPLPHRIATAVVDSSSLIKYCPLGMFQSFFLGNCTGQLPNDRLLGGSIASVGPQK